MVFYLFFSFLGIWNCNGPPCALAVFDWHLRVSLAQRTRGYSWSILCPAPNRIRWELRLPSGMSYTPKARLQQSPLSLTTPSHHHNSLINFSQYLKFQNAPSDKLALLKDKVFEVLQNVHKGGIDMHRLTSVIQRLRLRVHNTPLQSKLADSPSSIYHK